MLNSNKDDQGVNQIFKTTPALLKRSENRCKKIIIALKIKSDDKLLELGCGYGDYATIINRFTQSEVIGLDVSEKFIAEASQRNSSNDVSFIVGDVYSLPFPDSSFNFVYGNGILHHLTNKIEVFKEIKRVLKPQGCIAFIEPNIYNPIAYLIFRSFVRKFASLDPNEDLFTRKQIEKILISSGFKNVEIKPIDFILPVTPKWLLKINLLIDYILEKIPFLKQFSQSILIIAEKND